MERSAGCQQNDKSFSEIKFTAFDTPPYVRKVKVASRRMQIASSAGTNSLRDLTLYAWRIPSCDGLRNGGSVTHSVDCRCDSVSRLTACRAPLKCWTYPYFISLYSISLAQFHSWKLLLDNALPQRVVFWFGKFSTQLGKYTYGVYPILMNWNPSQSSYEIRLGCLTSSLIEFSQYSDVVTSRKKLADMESTAVV